MALRANHYDAAFEAYLRTQQVPYVAVDEARRALAAGGSLKSLDFVVSSPTLGPLLVDVKGRREPGLGDPGRFGDNWATADDLASLAAWERHFGGGFRGLLVFAYFGTPVFPTGPNADDGTFLFRDRAYRFFGVWASDYRAAMKVRSPRWDTVWVPTSQYRALRFPLDPRRIAVA